MRGLKSHNDSCPSGGRAPLQKGLRVTPVPAYRGLMSQTGTPLFCLSHIGGRLSAPHLPTGSYSHLGRRLAHPSHKGPWPFAIGCYAGMGRDALDGNVVWRRPACVPRSPHPRQFRCRAPSILKPHIWAGAGIARCSLHMQTLASPGPPDLPVRRATAQISAG